MILNGANKAHLFFHWITSSNGIRIRRSEVARGIVQLDKKKKSSKKDYLDFHVMAIHLEKYCAH